MECAYLRAERTSVRYVYSVTCLIYKLIIRKTNFLGCSRLLALMNHSPVKRCGNLMGRITASFRASLAPSRPATSFHWMFGFSMTMAPTRKHTPLASRTFHIHHHRPGSRPPLWFPVCSFIQLPVRPAVHLSTLVCSLCTILPR